MDINIVEAIDRVIKDSRKDDDSCIGKSDVEVLRELLNQVSPDEAANWRERLSKTTNSGLVMSTLHPCQIVRFSQSCRNTRSYDMRYNNWPTPQGK